jgi:hypothetical protein
MIAGLKFVKAANHQIAIVDPVDVFEAAHVSSKYYSGT